MSEYSSLMRDEPLFLAPRHRLALDCVLQEMLPGITVWAYGSRATGKRVSRTSDLDLAVEEELPAGLTIDVLEALDDSTLPVNVDLIALNMVDPSFAERIRTDFVLVQCGTTRA